MTVKQVIVIRHDLQMRQGKAAAQAAHASQEFLWRCLYPCGTGWGEYELSPEAQAWRTFGTTKIVCRVESLDELEAIEKAAREAGLEVHSITDAGKTEFHNAPTKTCIAIGPDLAEKIDPITGHLELL